MNPIGTHPIEDLLCVPPILAKSSHETLDFTSVGLGVVNCGWYCDNVWRDMYYTKDDQWITDITQIIAGSIGVSLAILLCIHLTCIHRYKTSQSQQRYTIRRLQNTLPPSHLKSKASESQTTQISSDMAIMSSMNSVISDPNYPKPIPLTKIKEDENVPKIAKPLQNFRRHSVDDATSMSSNNLKINNLRHSHECRRSSAPTNLSSFSSQINMRERKKASRGFMYQIPWIINTAYIGFMYGYLAPHIAGTEKLTCNPGEMTLANPNNGNWLCSITGFIFQESLYLIILYTIALSAALFKNLYFPFRKLPKPWKLHLILLSIIIGNGIYLLVNNQFAANNLVTCGATMATSSDNTSSGTVLYFYLIPSTIGAGIVPVLFGLNLYKLWKMSRVEVM